MKAPKKLMTFLLAASLLQATPIAMADDNVLQNQAVNGGTINQNIVFIDVDSHWASDAIYDMASKGYISGYEDSTFKPENSITREEFAKLIAVTFSLDLTGGSEVTYSDVQQDRWSYNYIEASKDYLTGYYPPKGQAFFSPGTKATREDVAVALVKVLGYTTDDLEDPNILERNFYDVDDISFGLRDYVALATEKKLISGYEDYTFRPEQPITRAEVATLLYRVIKSSAQDQTTGPSLNVSMPTETSNGSFYIEGTTTRGAKVTVNGTPVEVVDGAFKEGFAIDTEGTFDVTIISKLNSGKSTTVHKQIVYKTTGPVLKLNDVPTTATTDSLTVSGTVTDKNDQNPVVYLNDEKLYVEWNGSFSKTLTLEEGENTLTFKATNKLDKTTEVVKKVTFSPGGPVLKVNTVPEQTSTNKLTLSGTVTDKNDQNPVVYLNDEKLYVNWNGTFSKDVVLEDGENTFTFKAENKNGKVSTVVKKVVFESGGPVLKVDDVPSAVTTKTVTISGTVTDKNDPSPSVYINEEKMYVNWNGTFSKTFDLNEGDNVFTVKASNASGKVSTASRTVTFNVPAPSLKLDYMPEHTTLKKLTLSGTVTDKNDSTPNVYLNDEKLYVNWNGTFSKDYTLVQGENVFTFTATNKLGKTSTVTKSVYQD